MFENGPINAGRHRRSSRTRAAVFLWCAAFCLVIGWARAQEGLSPLWLWSSPLAHGSHIYDMAASDYLVVQVGECGQIYTSLDSELWVPRDSHTTRHLRAVTFFRNRIVITGENGTALYADANSPTNFTLLDVGTTNWLEAVAASPSLLVAVGDNGSVYTSTTGTNWVRRPQSLQRWLRGVAYGAGTFVTVGEGGFIATSGNGISWVQRQSGTPSNLNRVTWLTNRFVAVGDSGRVLTSLDASGSTWSIVQKANPPTKDLYAVAGFTALARSAVLVGGAGELRLLENNGSTWQNQTDPAKDYPAPGWTYYSAFWDGRMFLVGGRSGMLVEGFKTNDVAPYVWVTRTDPVRHWLWDVAQFRDLYVTVGDFGTIQTSDTGVDWDLEMVPDSATNSVLLGIGGRAGLFVAAGASGMILTSSNSVIWTAVQPSPVADDLQGVAASDSKIVVTGGNGVILTSADGAQWTRQNSGTTNFLSSVVARPEDFVAVGERGTILSSPDGATWSAQTSGSTNWLYRVRSIEGQLFAVGENGVILSSTDGVAWTARTSGSGNWLTDILLLHGVYYAFGLQGTVLASTNSIDWTSIGTVTGKSIYGAVADRHQTIAVGVEGLILRGQPGPLGFLQYFHSQGTNLFSISGQPGRTFNLERSADLSSWTNLVSLQFLDNSGLVVHESAATNSPSLDFYRAVLTP